MQRYSSLSPLDSRPAQLLTFCKSAHVKTFELEYRHKCRFTGRLVEGDIIVEQENYTSELYKLIVSGASIKSFVDVAARVLGNPVLVADCDMNCLGMSSDEVDDETWQFMGGRHMPANSDLADKILQENIEEKLRHSSRPVLNKMSSSPYRFLDTKITWKGSVYGILHVLEYNHEFRSEDRDIVGEVSRALALPMAEYGVNGAKSLSPGELALRYLLQESTFASSMTDGPVFTLEGQRKYIAIVAANAESLDWSRSLTTAVGTLSNCFVLCQGTVFEDKVVLLAQIPIKGGKLLHDWDLFEKMLARQRLTAAASNPFDDFHDLRCFYDQACNALQIGSRFSKSVHLFHYEDIGFYELLKSAEGYILHAPMYPPLQYLLEYDKENNTQYFRDLFIFLQNGGNVQATSRTLSLHKNTVNYRIKKIEEITGENLRNFRSLFRLHISVKIMYYREANTFSEKYHIPEDMLVWPVI